MGLAYVKPKGATEFNVKLIIQVSLRKQHLFAALSFNFLHTQVNWHVELPNSTLQSLPLIAFDNTCLPNMLHFCFPQWLSDCKQSAWHIAHTEAFNEGYRITAQILVETSCFKNSNIMSFVFESELIQFSSCGVKLLRLSLKRYCLAQFVLYQLTSWRLWLGQPYMNTVGFWLCTPLRSWLGHQHMCHSIIGCIVMYRGNLKFLWREKPLHLWADHRLLQNTGVLSRLLWYSISNTSLLAHEQMSRSFKRS